MARLNARLTALAGIACVSACAPAPVAQPSPTVSLQASEISAPKPSDEQVAYAMMASVAIRQSRFLTSTKTVGLYQSDDAKAPLYPIIRFVLDNNAYMEIHPGQMKIACTVPRRAGLRGTGATGQTCGLDVVDVLMQINSVQILRDTGYVGGYMTEVLASQGRPLATAYCFMAVYRRDSWYDVKNVLVKEPRDCAADRKH